MHITLLGVNENQTIQNAAHSVFSIVLLCNNVSTLHDEMNHQMSRGGTEASAPDLTLSMVQMSAHQIAGALCESNQCIYSAITLILNVQARITFFCWEEISGGKKNIVEKGTDLI